MRFRTDVLSPLAAALVLCIIAFLPASQSQTKANAPQETEVVKSVLPAQVRLDQYLAERSVLVASRSSVRTAYSTKIMVIGKKYIGTPYCHGGSSPRCFDCSGFTKYVYGKYGLIIPRDANRQLKSMKRVKRSKAQIGDLVFFLTRGGYAYHVGIYVGNNKVLHSPKPGRKVRIERIWSRRVVFARQS